jgi:hypothetical protein
MDNVVAVRVELTNGERRYFVTWGRIQDTVDPQPVETLVLRHSRAFSLGGEVMSAKVCPSLREAADSSSAPYFFECLLMFSAQVPVGDGYETWRKEREIAMEGGREIAYCGIPFPDSEGNEQSRS